jgi:hypothetical protein
MYVQRVLEFMNGPSCISTYTLHSMRESLVAPSCMGGGGGGREGGMATLIAEE